MPMIINVSEFNLVEIGQSACLMGKMQLMNTIVASANNSRHLSSVLIILRAHVRGLGNGKFSDVARATRVRM